MEGTNNSKWNLYSNRISYHQHESTTSISVIVTDEAAAIDSKGVLWCVLEDRLSSVTYVQGKLRVDTIDFEALDFLTLKNNTVKSIYLDKTGNLWIGTNGGGIYKKTNNSFSFGRFSKGSASNSLGE